MEDVLDVYHRPYDPARPVVTMDETSKQLTKHARTPLPVAPGRAQCIDHEYIRNGTANIFMVFEPLAGRREVKVTERHTRSDWAVLMREVVDSHYPQAETIVLVCDNLNTHNKASLYETFHPEEAKRIGDKLEIHYTPKHGSWPTDFSPHVAECELSHLSRQCLNRRIPDMETLKKEIQSWNTDRNNRAQPMNWQFTLEKARIKLKRLYPSYQT